VNADVHVIVKLSVQLPLSDCYCGHQFHLFNCILL